ncbi:MAG: hypothetical protein ACYTEQ_16715 [Planctomycetota bacterium]|jgi:hypothetical protein
MEVDIMQIELLVVAKAVAEARVDARCKEAAMKAGCGSGGCYLCRPPVDEAWERVRLLAADYERLKEQAENE